LSSEHTAATAQTAFRAASEELVQQVRKHKQRLRENRTGAPEYGRPWLALAHSNHAGGAQEPRPGAAWERRRADLAGYFGAHYAELLSFVQRQIGLRERLGELQPGQVEADEVLDEVVVAALEATPSPAPVSRGRWLLVLAAAAIRKLVKTYSDHQHGLEHCSLDADPEATDAPDPETVAATTEMMDQLALALAPLPRVQRHDLVLYLLEGFRPQELAQLSHRTLGEVEASLAGAETALRAKPGLPSTLRQRLRLGMVPQAS
jgi:DNA-directed RNA polymerase specialized sigma24 family protein